MGKTIELSEKNQIVWDLFQLNRIQMIESKQALKGEINHKSTMINIAQYKECAIVLNSLVNDFNHLTGKMIIKSKNLKPQKLNHINGFLLDCYNNDYIKLNKDVIIELLPEEYKKAIVKLLYK